MARIVPHFLRKRLHFLGFLLMLTSCCRKRKSAVRKKDVLWHIKIRPECTATLSQHARIHDAHT